MLDLLVLIVTLGYHAVTAYVIIGLTTVMCTQCNAFSFTGTFCISPVDSIHAGCGESPLSSLKDLLYSYATKLSTQHHRSFSVVFHLTHYKFILPPPSQAS
jgi:hypothetical protein